MSSPAASSSSGKRALETRASRKSGGGKQLLSPEPEATGAEQEADEHLPPSSRKAKPSRKGLEYVDIEAAEETGEQPSQEVASTRQSAREKAASAPAPPKRRPGRPRKNPVDPEQVAPRATLPTRKSNRRTATIQRAVSPTSSGNRSIYQESSDEEDDMDVLASPERDPASQQDQLLDEEVEEEEEAAPVASTSTAKTKVTAKRQGGQTSAAKKASAQPAKKASAKSKGKGRATSSAPAEENQANDVVAPGDGPWDGENDVDLLKEKRELFAEAMKVWKEGLEQSDRFKEIKERYNEIGLFHRTPYVDKAETKKTTWSPMERKVFLVAMDLLRNPFASRRYKSILEDHGINGVVTRGLKDRKSSQLKDKGEK